MAKILIVDDSWLTRRSLGSIMGGSGYEVIEAENGEDGIDVLQDHTERLPGSVLE